MARVDQQACYILHQKSFSETSLIIEVLTEDYGRLGLLAKGAKRPKSPFRGRLQPFTQNYLSWSGKGQLPTLTAIEPVGYLELTGQALYCGLYVNELVMRLTRPHDPHEGLFSIYHQAVQALETKVLEPSLRRFEMQLLQELGYGLMLTQEANSGLAIEADAGYQYCIQHGPVKSPCEEPGVPIAGQVLLSMSQDDFSDALVRQQSKRLMRYVLDHYLGDTPLNSRALFQSIRHTKQE